MPTHQLKKFPTLLFEKKIVLLMVAIFAVSLSVRLYKLGSQTLECDELYTIPAATGHQYVYLSSEAGSATAAMPITTSEYRSLLQPEPGLGLAAVRGVLKRNVHLPLYFYVLHYWIGLLGNSEWVLRFPSAFFGALAAVLVFTLGEELFGIFVGLVSSMLLAFSPDQIYFSQQARMYPLLVLLVVTSTYLIVLAAKHPARKWLYLAYALVSIGGLYTHYEYVFCLAAQTAFIWILSPEGRRHWSHWLSTQAAIAAAFLPWVLISVAQKKTSPEVIGWVHGTLPANLVLTEFLTKTARLISVPELPFGWVSFLLALVLLLIGGISLAVDRPKLFLLCSWIVTPILGIVLIDNWLGTRAISITRYWLVIAPALYLLISLGIERIRQRPVQIAVVAILGGFLVAAALLTAQGKLRAKPDRHQELAQYVESQVSDPHHTVVITEGLNSLPLALGYYAHREMNILRHKWVIDQLKQRGFKELIGGAPEILLLVSGQTRAAKLLEDNGYRLEGKPVQYGHVVTARYVLNGTISSPRPAPTPNPFAPTLP
ncbi:MAG: glycosyltransferase family 39 protein [Acidobacteriota bacterium]